MSNSSRTTDIPPEQVRIIIKNIELLQAQHNWTLEQLSQKSGLTTRTLMMMRRGKKGIRQDTLFKLARAFNVQHTTLLHPPDTEPEPNPLTPAYTGFNQEMRKLRESAELIARADPTRGNYLYKQLAGILHRMTTTLETEQTLHRMTTTQDKNDRRGTTRNHP